MRDQTDGSPAAVALGLFRESPYRPVRELQCDFYDGVLTVAGRLPSFFMKQIAQTLVRDLEGVSEIKDCIEVIS